MTKLHQLLVDMTKLHQILVEMTKLHQLFVEMTRLHQILVEMSKQDIKLVEMRKLHQIPYKLGDAKSVSKLVGMTKFYSVMVDKYIKYFV